MHWETGDLTDTELWFVACRLWSGALMAAALGEAVGKWLS